MDKQQRAPTGTSALAQAVIRYVGEHRMTYAGFSRRSGVDKGTLSNIVNDKSDPEKVEVGNIIKISKIVGKSVEELLSGRRSGEVDSVAQFANHVRALQIVARSYATALLANAPGIARDAGLAIVKDAKGEEGEKPFAVDSGLLLEVLGNLGQGHLAAADAEIPPMRAGSAERPKR